MIAASMPFSLRCYVTLPCLFMLPLWCYAADYLLRCFVICRYAMLIAPRYDSARLPRYAPALFAIVFFMPLQERY